VTTLSLDRLSRRQAAALAERVAGKPLPWEVLEQIVARTDGVPLFVEELTKTILESGLLEEADERYLLSGRLPELAIPASLQDSLMARLDRLATVKDLAQLAATLGRIFTHELLEAVSPLKDPKLSEQLSQLIEAELLYRRGSPPNVTYDFKHALIQDAAYSSLLRSRRQELHARIATILEERFPETIEAKPELLAHHFRHAGRLDKAIPYSLRAGDAAVARYAPAEARARYQEALDMARSLPPSDPATAWQVEAAIKLAGVAGNRREFEADLENLARAEALAAASGQEIAVAQIRYWLGRTQYVLGHFDEGVDHARQALELADRLGAGDPVTAPPVNLLARLHCLRGEPREAIAQARRSAAQMEQLGNRIEAAAVAGVLAFAYGAHGEFGEAFAAAERGVALAQELDHLPTLAACLHFRGVVRGWYGDLEVAVPSFEEAITLAERSGDVFRQYLAHGWRGEAYLHLDQVGQAEADLSRCLTLGDQIGTSFHRSAFEAFRARTRLLQGDLAAALRASERALGAAAQAGQDWSRSIALRIRAEVLLALPEPDLDAAEKAVRGAIGIQERQGCRLDLAWSRRVLARVLAARGAGSAARQELATAIRGFRRMSLSPDDRLATVAATISAEALRHPRSIEREAQEWPPHTDR
jgi:tetratricopeptide (TPR) repeat protein